MWHGEDEVLNEVPDSGQSLETRRASESAGGEGYAGSSE